MTDLTIEQRKIQRKTSVIRSRISTLKKIVHDLPPELPTPVELLNVEEAQDRDIIFAPNPGPQTEFLAASEQEVLYGGAAGGGKSYAIIVDPLRYGHVAEHRAIIFRRTNDELRELISKSQHLYPKVFPGAKWRDKQSEWILPSGASIWYTYLDRDEDVTRYQGQSFNFIAFDELTQWPTPYAWDYMRSRLRSTTAKLPLQQRATSNPGGVGAWWVRKMFIDPSIPNLPFGAIDIENDKALVYPKGHEKEGKPLFYRRFIPAKLRDNPHLFADGRYETNLLAMPEALRKQLLEGDWDVASDTAFPEFDKKIHVADKPLDIPYEWTRFRGCDWGYSSPACVLWMAIDYDNTIYVYREYYGKGKNAEEFARHILLMDGNDRISYGVMDGSTWAQRGQVGVPIPETMMRMGLRMRPSDRGPGSRKNGKMEVHRRLAISEATLKPRLIISPYCTNLIRTLAMLPIDRNNPEDVDTKGDDHAYDALRYGLMSRPMIPVFRDENTSPEPGFHIADPWMGY